MPAAKPKIIFVLNTFGLTGGVKVVFEHANHLAAKGYEVNLIHLLRLRPGIKNRSAAILKWFKYHLPVANRYFFPPRWFNLRPEIKFSHALSLKKIPIGAIVIATANETADAVNALNIPAARKFYFVQDYESWTRDVNEVDRTYSYDLKKIVISRRLRKLLKDKFNQESFGPVYNGVGDIFLSSAPLSSSPSSSLRGRILLLYHPAPHKGFNQALAAYGMIKKKWPAAELNVFGAYRLPRKYDSINNFYFRPTPEKISELYSTNDIFIYAALAEGFALTPLEAMTRGCTVVSSDVGAVAEYGRNGKSLIVVPPGNPEMLAAAALKLLNDPEELKAIGIAGRQAAREYSWDKASDQLEKILLTA